MVEVARPRVGENMHPGGGDGAKQPLGLIAIGIEESVDGGNHTLDFETFATRYVEGPVIEDLDLEPLEEVMLLTGASVPPIDTFSLQSQTLRIEPRGNLEAA